MIHQFRQKDLSIVIDVNSGAIHIVDDASYDLIEKIESGQSLLEAALELSDYYDEKVIEEAIEEIQQLINSGQLFTEDDYIDVVKSFKNRKTVVKALCLHIAHDCNLRCEYCFAEEGEYHGRRAMMSFEVGKKAIDFLVQNSGSRRNLEVDFFGGEPLMNFDVVKDLVIYARSIEKENNKNFRFTITTNGVLLSDDIMDFVNKHMHNIVLSIDGRPEVHDRMRPSPNGKGSYHLIIDKLIKMAESRNQKSYYVRGTYTHYNTDFAEDVLHLADLGFKEISVEPVVADDDMPYALKEADLPILFEQYDYLAEKMLGYKKAGKDFNFFHFMIDLNQGPCVAKRLNGCGSGTEYLAVTPWGDLYPCHQFVGMDEFKMGSVDEGVTNLEMEDSFKNCHVYTKEKCQSCWAKFYCSGGCTANAYNAHKDIHAVYELGCKLQKKRVECAIYLKAKELMG